ncbi:MAG: 30S ribosomal protein S20 [Mariprofundaceae bacterium]
MANHPSAIKRARQSEVRRARNRDQKSAMRSAVKRVDTAIAAGDGKQAREELDKAISLIDRAGQRGVIHKRQASRRVSRIVARVKGVSA